ncbi:MAG: GNAT family N-acetyltransferase [Patescibacteria group bacterium]
MQSTNLTTQQKAKIGYDRNLYIPNWGMQVMYKHAMQQPDLYRIELFYAKGKAVGALVARVRTESLRKKNKILTAIFVMDDYRRQGIGSQLLDRMGEDRRKCKAGTGVAGSTEFWQTNNVPLISTAEFNRWNKTMDDVNEELYFTQKELKCLTSTNQKLSLPSNVSCIATKSAMRLKEMQAKSSTPTRSLPKENSYQSM